MRLIEMIKIIGDASAEPYICLGIEEPQKWGKLFSDRKEKDPARAFWKLYRHWNIVK